MLLAASNVVNVAELMLYADEHCCALLRKAAFDFLHHQSYHHEGVGRLRAVERDSTNYWPPSLLLLSLLVRRSETSLDTTKVAALRQKLDEINVHDDGTREILCHRCKDAKESNGRFDDGDLRAK